MSPSIFLTIAVLSMIPITELRATIPLFMTCSSNNIPEFITTFLPNCPNNLPNFFLLWFLPRFTNILHDKFAPWLNKIIHKLHDFFIKKDRMWFIYIGIILLLSGTIHILVSQNISLQTSIIILILEIISLYIIHKLLNKIYSSSLRHKSIIHWFYKKVHKEHSKKFLRLGSLALIAIVAIPLPGTGSWTGSLIAFLMGIPYWKAISLIFIGILIAASIVTGLSSGILNGLGIF
jgi:uncharacterized membrane protein